MIAYVYIKKVKNKTKIVVTIIIYINL